MKKDNRTFEVSPRYRFGFIGSLGNKAERDCRSQQIVRGAGKINLETDDVQLSYLRLECGRVSCGTVLVNILNLTFVETSVVRNQPQEFDLRK